MGKFNRIYREGLRNSGRRLILIKGLLVPVCLILFIFGLFLTKTGFAQEKGTMAVLPFQVHAQKALEELKPSLQEMLTLQMEKRRFKMIGPEVINAHPLVSLKAFEMKDLFELGKALNVDWIIKGSLTQIGRRISIDLKAIDITKKRPTFSVFMAADSIDNLAETTEQIAASIEHQIAGVIQVDAVDVVGNQRIEKAAILAVVGTKKGDLFDYGQLDKDLRNIFKMGFFKDVKTETEDGPKGKLVTFKVIEKPSIGKIVFVGNEKMKSGKLRKELGIELYSILDQTKIKQSIENLREYYRKNGYYNVDIGESIEPLPNNEVQLKYEIAEHEKVFIRKIQFVGNTEFTERKLKKIMETSEKGFLSWITKSGYLDRKKLEFDVQKLASFYHNHGFITAKVADPKIEYEKEKGLTITIEVQEGPQYAVNEVYIEGDLIKPVDELMEKVQIGKEKAFNRETVRRDIQALRNVYFDEGYAYAEVKPGTKQDDEKHLVDIMYRISKGKKVRFERINIAGNTTTRDKVIRREMKIVEGEYFSGKKLKRSTANLHRLGFFEDVEVKTKKGSRDDLMVVDINVKERPTGSFSIGAGYSSEDAAFVMFQIAENNLFGNGQKLQAEAKIGGETQQYIISFVEPWLFDLPLYSSFDIFKVMHEYDYYTRDSMGGSVGLGFPLGFDDFTKGYIKYTYDDSDISDVSDDASVAIKDMIGSNVTSSITLAIKRDSRDRPWNTSKGSVNSASFEYAGLGGDVAFYKYLGSTAWYFPMFWETVFLVRGRIGYVTKASGGKLPVYQKFTLGGINTVRGFDYGSISPRDPLTGDRIGGEKMMVYNLEYRFPLLKEQGLVGLVFFDAGNVFTKDENYTFSGIRRSAGTGLRWYSPIGPLRLEYGWNLDRKDDEDSGRWEFTVGGTF
jgi:outer membrane protein insertion porin family